MKGTINKDVANFDIGTKRHNPLFSSKVNLNPPKRKCYLYPRDKILVGSATHQGKIRKKNEDAYLYDADLGLFVLADGIGGNRYGEVASSLTVKSIRDYVLDKLSDYSEKNNKSSKHSKRPVHAQQYFTLMPSALVEANNVVLKASLENERLDGMGTTVVVLLFSAFTDTIKQPSSNVSSFYLAAVGDSSIYSISKVDNKQPDKEPQTVKIKEGDKHESTHIIKKLTKDHTVAEMLIEANQISKEEGKKHHLKNVLTKYVGMKNQDDLLADLNILELQWKKNDYLLMCSDGLTNMLDDEEICQTIVTENDNWTSKEIIGKTPELYGEDPRLMHICNRLINKANERGGTDNITVILIQKTD